MKVFVVGGDTTVGRAAMTALRDAGHEISASVGTDAQSQWSSELGARPTRVDVFDQANLRAAFEGHQAVCDLTDRILPTARALFRKAWMLRDQRRGEGSRNIAVAAHAAGVERLVQQSTTLLYGDSGDEWLDCDSELAPTDHTIGALQAERHTGRFTELGGIGVSLRFALVYGPNSQFTAEMFADLRHLRVSPLIGRPDAYCSAVHEDDAGAAVVIALGLSAGAWNVADDQPLTRREYTSAAARVVGVRRVVRLGGGFAALSERRLEWAARSQRVANWGIRDQSGWKPRYPSAVEGYAAMESAG